MHCPLAANSPSFTRLNVFAHYGKRALILLVDGVTRMIHLGVGHVRHLSGRLIHFLRLT